MGCTLVLYSDKCQMILLITGMSPSSWRFKHFLINFMMLLQKHLTLCCKNLPSNLFFMLAKIDGFFIDSSWSGRNDQSDHKEKVWKNCKICFWLCDHVGKEKSNSHPQGKYHVRFYNCQIRLDWASFWLNS